MRSFLRFFFGGPVSRHPLNQLRLSNPGSELCTIMQMLRNALGCSKAGGMPTVRMDYAAGTRSANRLSRGDIRWYPGIRATTTF